MGGRIFRSDRTKGKERAQGGTGRRIKTLQEGTEE
jgi:hypothetical protein